MCNLTHVWLCGRVRCECDIGARRGYVISVLNIRTDESRTKSVAGKGLTKVRVQVELWGFRR